METDEALMLDFKGGSRDAFETLFGRYREPVYGFFRRRLPSADRAEDLAQETFLAVLKARGRYQLQASVRSYLYGIAFHLLLAERRRNGKVPQQLLGSEPFSVASPEAPLWVRQAFARLDVTDREILMLREYDQLSYAEIAELLGVPLNTVRSRLFRSRVALKELLEPRESEPLREVRDAHV